VGTGIGRRINRAMALAFILVLLVGGASIFLAWTISRGVERGRLQGLEAQAVDRIHTLLHRFVSDLSLALWSGPPFPHSLPGQALDELRRELAAYEALERAQGGDEARLELAHLEELKSLVVRLEALSSGAIQVATQGGAPSPAALAALNDLAHGQASRLIAELHGLHQRKSERAVDESQRGMSVISALYVAFAAGGAVLLLLGRRFLSRSLVLPITRLSAAALRIAGGDLSQRVPVRSGDEVGQLSGTFNLMAERLEAHEAERVNFEAELERQVKGRTRDLEDTAARLRATQAELLRSERIAVTGQIAAGVTHEIRTPLNSLAINIQLLRRELGAHVPSSTLREALNSLATVEYEITRINRILEEFVKFARLPAPRFEPVEVGPLLGDILELLGPQAAEGRVRADAPGVSSRARVRGDRDQLRDVFLNLGQNALHAMPNGGVLGVEVVERGDWVEIAVTDQGPGIEETDRELIFLPFVSTKADGLGLGLAIVRRIVDEHGGRVSGESRAGGGAAFVVRLPAAGPAGPG
jgi:signal transduction histidine kinase